MLHIQATGVEVQAELDLAHLLLTDHWNLDFPKPALLLGDEHVMQHIEFNSLRDTTRAKFVHGLYDSETNSIMLPDHLLENQPSWILPSPRAYRLSVLLHEDVHAVLNHINPNLRDTEVDRLKNSRSADDRERGWTYAVFHEGMAYYLTIGVSLTSEDEALRQLARNAEQSLTDGFTNWATGSGVEAMARSWGTDPDDYRTTLLTYFGNEPGYLELYKNPVGYSFVQGIEPNLKTLKPYTLDPPRVIRELIYPEEYLKRIA